jgi:hypothetical protein
LAMPSSPRQRFMPMPWAKRSRASPPGCGDPLAPDL